MATVIQFPGAAPSPEDEPDPTLEEMRANAIAVVEELLCELRAGAVVAVAYTAVTGKGRPTYAHSRILPDHQCAIIVGAQLLQSSLLLGYDAMMDDVSTEDEPA